MRNSNSQEGKYDMMLEAPIPGLIGRMSVPTIISMLVTSFYNMADTFFVGRISTSATAAVGVVFPVMAIIQALGFFCGHGSGAAISRKLGAQEDEDAKKLASTGFFLSLILGILVTVIGLIFLTPLARLLGSTESILPYATTYLSIILIGAPFMTAQFTLNNQIRYQGNAFYAMIGITTGAVLNIILDPVLIFGMDLGIAGAALATVTSQFVSFVILFIMVQITSCLTIRLKNLSFKKDCLSAIAGAGFPSLCRQGLASLATTLLNVSANPFGDAAIAAMSVVSRISMFASSAVMGFGQGFQPVCGYNYGAKRYDRVRESFWFCVRIVTVVLFILSILGFCFAGQLIGLFRDDPDVIRIGTTALRLQCVTFTLNGWIIMNNMMTQTLGKTLYASIMASARQGLFFIPALLIFPRLFGLLGIQISQPISDLFTAVTAVIICRLTFSSLKKEENAA